MRRTPINAVSPKRKLLNVSRKKFVVKMLEERFYCEANIPEICRNIASDVHEIKTRARGGSIVDESNVLCLCRFCHSFITDHPAWATENGFIVHSWSGPAEILAAKRARVAYATGTVYLDDDESEPFW